MNPLSLIHDIYSRLSAILKSYIICQFSDLTQHISDSELTKTMLTFNNWLQIFTEPWNEVSSKWSDSYFVRKEVIKNLDLSQMYNNYPCLASSRALDLVIVGFLFMLIKIKS
jgi:hypothetical protein